MLLELLLSLAPAEIKAQLQNGHVPRPLQNGNCNGPQQPLQNGNRPADKSAVRQQASNHSSERPSAGSFSALSCHNSLHACKSADFCHTLLTLLLIQHCSQATALSDCLCMHSSRHWWQTRLRSRPTSPLATSWTSSRTFCRSHFTQASSDRQSLCRSC